MSRYDPGLQPERTELAWRRTSLALAVGSLVALRLLPATLGDPLWAFTGVAGLVAAAALWVASRRRARRVVDRLVRGGHRAVLPGAGLLAALAAGATLAGAAGMAVGVGAAFAGPAG